MKLRLPTVVLLSPLLLMHWLTLPLVLSTALNEIAAAINDDANAFTTLTSAIAAVTGRRGSERSRW